MGKLNSFKFIDTYYEAAISVPEETDRLDFLMAICQYMFTDELPELSGVPAAMFEIIKPDLDISKKRAEAGAKGGRSSSKKRNEA